MPVVMASDLPSVAMAAAPNAYQWCGCVHSAHALYSGNLLAAGSQLQHVTKGRHAASDKVVSKAAAAAGRSCAGSHTVSIYACLLCRPDRQAPPSSRAAADAVRTSS